MKTIETWGWMAGAMALAMAACSPASNGGGGDDDCTNPAGCEPSSPDAAPAAPVACGQGLPPCTGQSECIDFGQWGGQVCAAYCTESSQCGGTNVCISDSNGQGICATAPWGGPGGIDPEVVCNDEQTCNVQWGANQNGCLAYYNACLSGLSSGDLAYWTQQVDNCMANDTACDTFFNCLQAVPGC